MKRSTYLFNPLLPFLCPVSETSQSPAEMERTSFVEISHRQVHTADPLRCDVSCRDDAAERFTPCARGDNPSHALSPEFIDGPHSEIVAPMRCGILHFFRGSIVVCGVSST